MLTPSPLLICFLFCPDPVPAYKSWHDDSESGEAQLSPLAGRMVPLPPLPLEEDGEEEEGEAGQDVSASSSRSHPHLLARRFLDFGAHSAQRFLQQDLDATSPIKAHQRYIKVRRCRRLAVRFCLSLSAWMTLCIFKAKASIVWLQGGNERRRFSDPPTHQEASASEEENQTV